MANGKTHKTALSDAAHKKTVKQIADRCGLNSTQRFRLENAINGKGYSHDPTIAEVVTALYRQIEKLEKEKASLGGNLDDLLFCIEDFQLGDYSPLMDEVFDSRYALDQAGITRRRTPRKEG